LWICRHLYEGVSDGKESNRKERLISCYTSNYSKEVEVKVKWWYWALLGLGIAMVIGALIYGFVSGQLG